MVRINMMIAAYIRHCRCPSSVTSEKIEDKIRFAPGRLSLAIAMTGKVLGVIDMRFGLRRILDKDPIENLRADQLLLCPSLLERLPGHRNHEGHRGLIHPLMDGLPTDRFLFAALETPCDLLEGRLAREDRLELTQ